MISEWSERQTIVGGLSTKARYCALFDTLDSFASFHLKDMDVSIANACHTT